MSSQVKYYHRQIRSKGYGRPKFCGLHFRRQQVVDGFIADFYCHAARLIVEVDGDVHDDQAEYDAARDGILAAHGLRVYHVSNARLNAEVDTVLDEIRRIIDG